LLERASSLHDDLLTTRLTVQYRTHDSIAMWASKEMYNGLLQSSRSVASHLLADSPVVKVYTFARSVSGVKCGSFCLPLSDSMLKGHDQTPL